MRLWWGRLVQTPPSSNRPHTSPTACTCVLPALLGLLWAAAFLSSRGSSSTQTTPGHHCSTCWHASVRTRRPGPCYTFTCHWELTSGLLVSATNSQWTSAMCAQSACLSFVNPLATAPSVARSLHQGAKERWPCHLRQAKQGEQGLLMPSGEYADL